jgi:hypothetical protein
MVGNCLGRISSFRTLSRGASASTVPFAASATQMDLLAPSVAIAGPLPTLFCWCHSLSSFVHAPQGRVTGHPLCNGCIDRMGLHMQINPSATPSRRRWVPSDGTRPGSLTGRDPDLDLRCERLIKWLKPDSPKCPVLTSDQGMPSSSQRPFVPFAPSSSPSFILIRAPPSLSITQLSPNCLSTAQSWQIDSHIKPPLDLPSQKHEKKFMSFWFLQTAFCLRPTYSGPFFLLLRHWHMTAASLFPSIFCAPSSLSP